MRRQNRWRGRWGARLILAGVGGLSLGGAPAAALVTCSPADCTPACDSSCDYYTCNTNNTGTFEAKTLPITIPSQSTACSEPDITLSYPSLPFTHKGTFHRTIPVTLSYVYTTCTKNTKTGASCITCGDTICNGTENCSTCPGDCGVCPTWTCSVNTTWNAFGCGNTSPCSGADVCIDLGACPSNCNSSATVTGSGSYTGLKNPPSAVAYCGSAPCCGQTWTKSATCTKN